MIRGIIRNPDRAVLGVVVVGLLMLVLAAINSGWLSGQFRPQGDTVRARFSDTGQLKANDPVRVQGVKVGYVTGLRLDAGGRTATVEMKVDDSVGSVYRDARAAIRFRTLLGGSFAVDLDPGSATAGPLTGAIAASRTSNQVEVEDLVAFDQGSAKAGLRSLLAEVPHALGDPDQPSRALRALRATSPGLETTLSAARGANEGDLRGLVRSASRVVRALDSADDGIRRIVQGAAVTMRTTAVRDEELRQTLVRGAAVQPEAQRTLSRLGVTLDAAQPLVDDLRRAAPAVAPTLRGLRPTLASTRRLLDQAEPLIEDLRPTVRSLARSSRMGRPLLDALAPSLERLEAPILPDLAERDPITKLRTYEIAGPVIASLNGAGSTFDREGHLFRFPALGGQRALSGELPCASYLGDPETDALVKCQAIGELIEDYVTWKPLTFGPADR